MPNTPEKEQELIKRFVDNLQVGIPGVESGADSYAAQNKEGTAAGKYQFTSYWLKRAGKHSIQSFAKNNPDLFDVPESLDDFKNDPELQDAYFRYYAAEVLYPQAKKAYAGPNPAELSIEEMGALFHFKPPYDDKYGNTGAYKQIRTGVFDKGTKKGVDGAEFTNTSSLRYLEVFNKTLENSSNTNIEKKELIEAEVETKKTEEEIIAEYNKKEAAIDNNEYLSDKDKEIKRRKLQEEAVKAGNKEIINKHIENENAARQEDYDKNRRLEKVLKNVDVKEVTKGNFSFELNADNADDLQKVMEENPELFKNARLYKDKSLRIPKFVVGGQVMGGTIKERKGGSIFIGLGDGNKFAENLYKKAEEGQINLKQYEDSNNSFYNWFSSAIPAGGVKGGLSEANYSLKSLPNEVEKPKERFKIADDIEVKTTPKSERRAKQATKQEESQNEQTPVNKETDKKIENEAKGDGLTNQFFDTALALNENTGQEFSYKAGKQELNTDALTGLFMGLIGDKQARNAKIPLRTEEISDALKSYMADLKERVDHGMPVEIEAKMRGELADSYQGGLEQLNNLSGGNRATILGNLGSLEQAKNKGLIGIQVADFEAKDRAFAQYGQALQYANEFDARRDIANHGIKYQEAKERQEIGRTTAISGMAKMMDALKYQKENGPGSANDMYRSMLMQKIFGFDPKKPDDGSGTEVGTQSWYEAKKAKVKEQHGMYLTAREQFHTLNKDQQAVVDQLTNISPDVKHIGAMTQYLKENPDLDLKKINFDNWNTAIAQKDFGLLSGQQETAVASTSEKMQQQGSADEALTQNTQAPELATPGFNNQNNGLLGMTSYNPTQEPNNELEMINNLVKQIM